MADISRALPQPKAKADLYFFSLSFITSFWSQCNFFEGGRQFEITRALHNQTQQPIYNISTSFIRRFGLNLISWKVFFSSARFSPPVSSVRDRSNFSIAQGDYPQLSTCISHLFSSCPQLFNYVPEGTSDSASVCAPALSSGELLYASLFHESFFL